MEETDNHAVLIAAYSDVQLRDIEQRLKATLTPAQTMEALRWMLPHVNASERATMLGGMKRGAPPAAFEAVLSIARETLSQRDFYKLERALA